MIERELRRVLIKIADELERQVNIALVETDRSSTNAMMRGTINITAFAGVAEAIRTVIADEGN